MDSALVTIGQRLERTKGGLKKAAQLGGISQKQAQNIIEGKRCHKKTIDALNEGLTKLEIREGLFDESPTILDKMVDGPIDNIPLYQLSETIDKEKASTMEKMVPLEKVKEVLAHFEILLSKQQSLMYNYSSLVNKYEIVTKEYVKLKREYDLINSNRLVSINWVAEFFDVSKRTALKMMKTQKRFVHGDILRFYRSSVIALAKTFTMKGDRYDDY